jgi:hypothetical protein
MSYAKQAVKMLNAYASGIGINANTIFSFEMLDCFDIVDQGSHKYIPSDELTKMLGLPVGAGVYGYVKFSDGSYVLRLCSGQLASWSGDVTESPEF